MPDKLPVSYHYTYAFFAQQSNTLRQDSFPVLGRRVATLVVCPTAPNRAAPARLPGWPAPSRYSPGTYQSPTLSDLYTSEPFPGAAATNTSVVLPAHSPILPAGRSPEYALHCRCFQMLGYLAELHLAALNQS